MGKVTQRGKEKDIWGNPQVLRESTRQMRGKDEEKQNKQEMHRGKC